MPLRRSGSPLLKTAAVVGGTAAVVDRAGESATAEKRGAASRYQMREKLVSIGDDFYIETADGRRAFFVDGKALRVRQTLLFKDMQGAELCHIQERMLRVKDTMNIEQGDRTVATVKKAIISPVRERYTVNVKGGPDMEIQGNILDHEYRITQGDRQVAEVSKKWFRVRDTYGVDIAPGQDDILVLAATVCIEQMSQ